MVYLFIFMSFIYPDSFSNSTCQVEKLPQQLKPSKPQKKKQIKKTIISLNI